jgi:glycosyltransferase involved in cell wall biosynthesis
MKTAWIYPVNRRDGISLYAQRYIQGLENRAAVESFDVSECAGRRFPEMLAQQSFDIVHVQYEPSFFVPGRKDIYTEFSAALRIPLVVTVHEVYERFPNVFPREEVSGHGLLKKMKLWLYDFRHPVQTMYAVHRASSFGAVRVLVHYPYQHSILCKQGVASGRIEILPHPVVQTAKPGTAAGRFNNDAPVHIGATGFININYDYDLLFSSLENLDMPWRFTWIGGVRRREDTLLMKKIRREIEMRSWQNKFTVSGWVSDAEQQHLLSTLDIYLALFSNRSTSGSLLMAVGAHKPVIATSLPLTRDLNRERELALLVEARVPDVVEKIRMLAASESLRNTLSENAAQYARNHSYQKMAIPLYKLYERVCAKMDNNDTGT